MNTAGGEPLVSTREASKLLGVAVRTVQLWVESGVLPAWKTAGGHRRIARSTVEQLMAQRQQAISRPSTASTSLERVRHLKIVLVDDNPDFILLFSTVVKQWDLPVELTCATDGFDGLVKIGQVQPDLIVTDLNMPGMDGFQMVRSLEKSHASFHARRVVVTSALSPDDVRARGGLPPEVVYFQKPIPFAQVQEIASAVYADKALHRTPPMDRADVEFSAGTTE